ncbi:MAG: MarR family transcriptional regulator [Erysipelotrichaceae bacterium]|nr:MarR family transcriptional regulator [Erysipelotrichaceae bacterium]MDY5251265.1 helix-turn-helix domain-containing protein [Erysipelotrichaceae bacterium]
MQDKKRLGYMIKKLHLKMDKHFKETLASTDLTQSQAELLLFLHRNQDKDMTQKDIETYYHISNPTVTGLINRLENKGYVKRVVSKEDARKRIIIETAKAKELHSFIKGRATAFNNKLLSCLDDEQQQLLLDLLWQVLESMEGEDI